ncbi:hypothetical protein KJ819_02435 [Patescibacteria group bacterium]|nr:hypothetical protein [Patescibacteria group bacterium]MBU1500860.1 hypothetical protein [Patescibacteria group bacterium]MBU2080915.1 hypothetical protein [Patescibacteria group bacterium]MBU2124020.1 hypothetical protein [Patescibacteria group bacterium]MBU2194689.1 hypothetical protein [Patescibacteria group bacterium]
MGILIKLISVFLVLGAGYLWINGRIEESPSVGVIPSSSLVAGVVLSEEAPTELFNESGTVLIDTSQGLPGKPFLLYTTYTQSGKPQVKTKRLVFENQDSCAQENLPCSRQQPAAPVSADEEIRVVGIVDGDTVKVQELYRLAS